MKQISNAIVMLSATLLFSACASAGATYRSGVADTFLDEEPWYAGAGVVDIGRVAHAPITFQRGATQPATFDVSDKPGTPIAALLAEMNAYLDSLGATVRLQQSDVVARTGTPPDVHFGCERLPHDDCENGGEEMRLAIGRPSADWITWAQTSTEKAGSVRLLVMTLEIGNYLPRQKNLRGNKEVQLGTSYHVDVPWLTATNKPASVLQLTGALMDKDGRAIRIGAEGLVVRRTNALVGGLLGAQALISDEDVEKARTARREELPGQPLVWQVALRNMLAQLAGIPELTTR